MVITPQGQLEAGMQFASCNYLIARGWNWRQWVFEYPLDMMETRVMMQLNTLSKEDLCDAPIFCGISRRFVGDGFHCPMR